MRKHCDQNCQAPFANAFSSSHKWHDQERLNAEEEPDITLKVSYLELISQHQGYTGVTKEGAERDSHVSRILKS